MKIHLQYWQSGTDSRRYAVQQSSEFGLVTSIVATPAGIIVNHEHGEQILETGPGRGPIDSIEDEAGRNSNEALSCGACGRECASSAGLAAHQRRCSAVAQATTQ